jgi:uncharacterized protein
MTILADIVHPADVHFFKLAIREWKRNGHEVVVTTRDKEMTIELLESYELDFHCISHQGKGLYGLAKELMVRDFRLYRIARRVRPDVLIGFSGISISHIAWLLGKPSIVFYDTEFARLSNALTYPLATVVCTPTCYNGNIGTKQIRFPSYKELAYLHPDHFTPDSTIVQEAGVDPTSKFFIMRFVGWGAAHDRKEKGMSYENKIRFVNELSNYGKVLISSEGELPDALAPYQLRTSIDKIHHIMAFATLYIGESATMASECAVLGIPAIFIATTWRGYTIEQEKKYGLLFNFSDKEQEQAFDKMKELLTRPLMKEEWRQRREHMLSERINSTTWMVDFIEEYLRGMECRKGLFHSQEHS